MPGGAQPTVLDLFAGAGGFTLGFERAGFRSVGAIEVDDVAAKTLDANFGRRPLDFLGSEQGDMTRLDAKRVARRIASLGLSLDVITAGPPCQGFSRIGRGKIDALAEETGAFRRDRRNSLYRQAIEFARVLQPKVFVFENVTGILHVRGRNIAEDVCDALSEIGYDVVTSVLNSAWYGVPQIRERVFIIGVRRDLRCELILPVVTHDAELGRGSLCDQPGAFTDWRSPDYFVRKPKQALVTSPCVTVAEALGDLPPFTEHLAALAAGTHYKSLRGRAPLGYRVAPGNDYQRQMREWPGFSSNDVVTDQFCRWTPRDYAIFRRMRAGDRYPEAIAIAQELYASARADYVRGRRARPRKSEFIPPYPTDTFPEKWRKLDPSKPSWTVTAHLGKDTYSHIHYEDEQARSISVREAARLQSFPDGYKFIGNMGDAFRQIGNAVPPLMASAVALAVKASLASAEAQSTAPRRRPRQSSMFAARIVA